MGTKPGAYQSNVTYDEFEPETRWAREATFDTLSVHLPGFRKEQMKVQVTSTNKLRIIGERPLSSNKLQRFRKELPIPENCDGNEISARFEGGKLSIKLPKIIRPLADQQPGPKAEAKAQTEAPKPQSDYSEAQKKGQELPAQEVNPPSAGQEQASQAAGPPKTTSAGEQPSKKASGVGSASADSAKTASRKSSEKKGAEDLAEEGKINSGAEKDKKLDAAAAKAKSEEAGSSNGSRDKFRVEEMKQALGGLVMEMKQQRKFLNMIVAGLLVLVAWIYARNAIGSVGKSKN